VTYLLIYFGIALAIVVGSLLALVWEGGRFFRENEPRHILAACVLVTLLWPFWFLAIIWLKVKTSWLSIS